jgi:acyl-CoA dehydrogenase
MHELLLYASIAVGWLVLFVGAVCILAYRRASLELGTGVLLLLLALYWVLGTAPDWWKVLVSVPFAILFLLNIRPLRRRLVTRPFMKKYRKLLPAMSSTEREALDAGTVWWDGELFTGGPNWQKLMSAKAPALPRPFGRSSSPRASLR